MATVVLLAGLGFGDEGKGTVTDYLVRTHSAKMVVRYNGGAQAAHNVVLPDGRHHTFAQFGSGTFVPGVRTHLSRHMRVNPISMMSEERHLRSIGVEDAFARTTIERGALVTNPFQVAANRLREMLRGNGRHGSCGMGVGETTADFLDNPDDALVAGDLTNLPEMRRKLTLSQERKRTALASVAGVPWDALMMREWSVLNDPNVIDRCVEMYTEFAKAVEFVDESFLKKTVNGPGTIIFEGAQGVLLDEDWGFHPYTTWTRTTFVNAYDLLVGCDPWPIKRIGIIRAHMTRHGAGPFPTEAKDLTHPTDHNCWGEWQQNFRVGHLDLPLHQYAIKATGKLDGLVVTHLDHFERFNKVCTGYSNRALHLPFGESNTPERLDLQEGNTKVLLESQPIYETPKTVEALLSGVEQSLGVPITLCSYGPTANDKRKT